MPKAVSNNKTNNQAPKAAYIVATSNDETPSRGKHEDVYEITVFSDENASKIMTDWVNAKGNSPFKKGKTPKSVCFKIPVASLNKFVQTNMYRVLETALKHNGFAMDPTTFINEVEDKNEVSDEDNKKADASIDKLMDAMLDHFEGKINDPMVVKLLSQMHMFDPNTGQFKKLYEFLQKDFKTSNNILKICAQWRNNNRPGIPTYVATKAQWKRDYNRYVVDGATPLVMATPRDNTVQAISKTLSDNNLTNRDYLHNSHIRHTARSIYNDHGSAANAANGFVGKYVYDISDTEVIPGMPDLFNENEGLESNLWADKWNQKALDSGINPETVKSDNELVANAGFTSDDNNLEKVKSSLATWCEDNQQLSSNVQAALNRNDIVGAVRAYFETESYIDREHTPNIKNAILNMCVFAALNHYGIAPADMLKSFQASRDYLVSANNKISKTVRVEIAPFYSNFVNMVETNAKKQQTNECKEYGKTFATLWNKMVNINKRNHNENIF